MHVRFDASHPIFFFWFPSFTFYPFQTTDTGCWHFKDHHRHVHNLSSCLPFKPEFFFFFLGGGGGFFFLTSQVAYAPVIWYFTP